jgi:peptidoglycan/LPS O-acetylase OafA/YrhL
VHLPLLDGVRGLAGMLVVLHHYVSPPTTGSLATTVIGTLTGAMWCGVDLFFVLSGFLITRNLLTALSRPRYYVNFYGRRTLRIFPLYYAVLLVAALAAVASDSADAAALRSELPWVATYTTNLKIALSGYGGLVNSIIVLGHFWSLAVEEHFYLVWPFLIRRAAAAARLVTLTLTTIGVASLTRVALAMFGFPLAAYVFTLARADSLAIGGFLAVATMNAPLMEKVRGVSRPLGLLALVGLGTLTFAYHGLHEQDFWTQTLGYTFFALGSGVILVECTRERPAALARWFFGNSVMRRLGTYSYGIYVYHMALKPQFDAHLSTQALLPHVGNRYVVAGALHTLLAIAVFPVIAAISYHVFEAPLLALKDRLFGADSRPASIAPIAATTATASSSESK